MSKNCDMIKDLLPLYADDVWSDVNKVDRKKLRTR